MKRLPPGSLLYQEKKNSHFAAVAVAACTGVELSSPQTGHGAPEQDLQAYFCTSSRRKKKRGGGEEEVGKERGEKDDDDDRDDDEKDQGRERGREEEERRKESVENVEKIMALENIVVVVVALALSEELSTREG